MIKGSYDETAHTVTRTYAKQQSRSLMPSAAVLNTNPILIKEFEHSVAKVDETAIKVAKCASTQMDLCNLTLEALKFGLAKLQSQQKKVHNNIDEATQAQKTIEKLIQLSSQLPMSEKDTILSDAVLEQFKDLEKSGITILQPNEKKLTPARLVEIKSLINSNNDRLKTELQIKFTTKIQVAISDMNSLIDSLKLIQKTSERFMEFILENMRKA